MDINIQRLDALIRQAESTKDDWGIPAIRSGQNKAVALGFEQVFDALQVAFMEIRQLRTELDELRAGNVR